MKLAVVFAAFVSVLSFSSCLNSDGDSNYPNFQAVVTVTGDEILGYRLYADYGPVLIPTSQSVAQLPGLKNIKRAIVAFDVVGEENVTSLDPKKSYNVVLNAAFCAGIPTSTIIDTYENEAATDTLFKNQDPIVSFEGLYALKGYANVTMTIPYDRTKMFYMNVGYDSDKDVDASKNTLSLTVYYDNNTSNTYEQGRSVFSFKLPEEEYGKFTNDSIDVVLKAKTTSSGEELQELKCKMAKSDLFAPRGY